MSRRASLNILVAAAMLSFASSALGAPVQVVNGGGEAYPTGPNTAINPGGVAPVETTGWNATLAGAVGEEGVEGINNQTDAMTGGNTRLAFGAVNSDPATDDDSNLAEDFVLFQETGRLIQDNDRISMNWIGRAFFHFTQDEDFQTSFFGYFDDDSNLVMVDTLQHPGVVAGVWTPAAHTSLVSSASPLIGEDLVIGFFTDTPSQAAGGFTSVDNVTLDVAQIPEPASLAQLSLGALSALLRARRQRVEGR